MALPSAILVSSTDFIDSDHETVFLQRALNKRGINSLMTSFLPEERIEKHLKDFQKRYERIIS
jgi:hypothetical protein